MDNNGEQENTFLESPMDDDATMSAPVESEMLKHDTQPRMEKPKRERRGMPFHYYVLWVVVLGSLVMNAITLREIAKARVAARQAISDAIAVLSGFQQQTFTYNVNIDDTMVIDTNVPVDEIIEIPIHELIEVRTGATVTLLDIPGVGPITHNVPVAADVPIDVVFEAPLKQDFHIVLPIPVQLDIPIELAIIDTPLYGTIDDVIMRLQGLDAQLEN